LSISVQKLEEIAMKNTNVDLQNNLDNTVSYYSFFGDWYEDISPAYDVLPANLERISPRRWLILKFKQAVVKIISELRKGYGEPIEL
jgi:hypothetical protein